MSYYEHSRPEIVALIPHGARRVVDVGCAAGMVGKAIKAERPAVEVRGIEPIPHAVQRARELLDDAVMAHAEDPMPASWPSPDCVVFADVLEHLVDPWTVLRSWRSRLQPGGTVVASIPNVAHHSVRRRLLTGRWDYVDAGILDRTHLRFFTRETIADLFEGAGLRIQLLERVVDPGRMRRVAMLVGDWGFPRLADLWTIQFLVLATPVLGGDSVPREGIAPAAASAPRGPAR